MHLYRCDLILHDYLFFATTERGKVAETGPFVHNYALTYALGWARSAWYSETQEPHYPEELAAAWRTEAAYVTPATLLRGGYLINQYNTMPESYGLGKGQSIGYPDWGFAKCLRPAAHFRFYVVSRNLKMLPRFIRLGKFMAKAEVRAEHARRIERATGTCIANALLAWDDLKATPTVFDLTANALPTRLINQGRFTNADHLRAEFSDGRVVLPLAAGYLSAADKRAFKCKRCLEALKFLETALCGSW
ncbi:MAG TPA: type I-D CRISPR-associated protein Cas5/Csc1 [Anaerolineae bacterium]|nr:type I-D CRISPR-associated protein Cas5/Csc1 [Pyrinomonadaceae bacterium]HKZ87257.1 type I-D CRISPR-associated protein Cas5/Csc1 [Anaerolineae bacterium]